MRCSFVVYCDRDMSRIRPLTKRKLYHFSVISMDEKKRHKANIFPALLFCRKFVQRKIVYLYQEHITLLSLLFTVDIFCRFKTVLERILD